MGTCRKRRRLPAVAGLVAVAALGGASLPFAVLPSARPGGRGCPRQALASPVLQPSAGAPGSRGALAGSAWGLLLALSAFGVASVRTGREACARGAGSASPVLRQAVAEASEEATEGFVVEDDDEDDLPPPPPPFDPAAQVGAVAPLGYFDPLGFCPPGDEGKFRGLRAAELKHGRVAMLAAVGAVAQHYIRFPFFGLPSSPSGLKATYLIPSAWFFTMLVFVSAIVELLIWTQDPRREVGDFGDPLGLKMYDEDMRNRELNNGRFAMFAAIGIIAGELATGKDAVEQLGL